MEGKGEKSIGFGAPQKRDETGRFQALPEGKKKPPTEKVNVRVDAALKRRWYELTTPQERKAVITQAILTSISKIGK